MKYLIIIGLYEIIRPSLKWLWYYLVNKGK